MIKKTVRWHGADMQHIDTIFLDRDGTLIEERHYLHDPEDVCLIPGVAAPMRRLSHMGLRFFLVSNQSGIGRGLFSLKEYQIVHQRLEALLAREDIQLSGTAFCPHAPDQHCTCRKPLPGLWHALRATHYLCPQTTIMIGDKKADLGFGQAVGCAATVLVRTGHGHKHARELELPPLAEALDWCPPHPSWPTLQARSLTDFLLWLVQLKSHEDAHRI